MSERGKGHVKPLLTLTYTRVHTPACLSPSLPPSSPSYLDLRAQHEAVRGHYFILLVPIPRRLLFLRGSHTGGFSAGVHDGRTA